MADSIFSPVPDDPRVREQALHVGLGVAGHPLAVEAVEGLPERRALVEDREPRQAGLEAFEAELLEQVAVVRGWPTPLRVVVAGVGGGGRAPPAPHPLVVSRHGAILPTSADGRHDAAPSTGCLRAATFEGRVALVTGGGRGIGRTTCAGDWRRLGAAVVIAAIPPDLSW